MKIVLVSFYYPPDLGAGSFRMGALVEALQAEGGDDLEIEVLTTRPHRYAGHQPQAAREERQGRVRVVRFALPKARPGMAGLARSYLAFARQCLDHARGKRADVVLASASRLIPAVIGRRVAQRLKARLYLDIRDLFALNFAEMHPQWWWRPVNRAVARLERRTLAAADHVSLVSEGFRTHLAGAVAGIPCSVHPNGVDEAFVDLVGNAGETPGGSGPLEVVYAGNIGRAQALHEVVPALAEKLAGRARFLLYGDGRARPWLTDEIARRGLDNVFLHDPVARDRLPRIYRGADVLFLHLGAVAAFSATIPSKLFEYAASGRPIWAGVDGVAAKLLAGEVDNVAVFRPGDVQQALEVLQALQLCHTPRPGFVESYGRGRIMRAMAAEVIALAS